MIQGHGYGRAMSKGAVPSRAIGRGDRPFLSRGRYGRLSFLGDYRPVKNLMASAALGLLLAHAAIGTLEAQSQDAAQPAAAPTMTPEILGDPEKLKVGEQIWHDQCGHCHGSKAYPGKAPKLKPRKYTPEFVYDRVTNGFRGMPPWVDVYNEEERVSVVAYILSKQFSP